MRSECIKHESQLSLDLDSIGQLLCRFVEVWTMKFLLSKGAFHLNNKTGIVSITSASVNGKHVLAGWRL